MFTANIAANHAFSSSVISTAAQQVNSSTYSLNGVGIKPEKAKSREANITLESSAFTEKQIKDLIDDINQIIEV